MRGRGVAGGSIHPVAPDDRPALLARQLAAISGLAIDLASAPPEADLVSLFVERLRSLTGAVAVTFSDYDADARELRLAHIATDGAALSRLNQLLGHAVLGMRMPVSAEMQERILSTLVAHVPDMTTLTLGRIPAAVGAAIERMFGVADRIVLGFQREGRLIGTAAVLTRTGEPEVADEVLTVFSNLVSAALVRRRAEQDLVTSERQFRQAQKMESIGRLAGGVAHDFNNLLTAIMGNMALAREDVPAGHPARDRLDEALRAGESAAALTRQLLAFSRKQMIDPRVVQLNEVVHGVERLLQRLIGEHIELRTALVGDLWPVRIDPVQFEQVLVNLAVNARDAMPKGGRLVIAAANVVLEAADCASRPWMTPGHFVALTVSDTGAGMTDEVKAHLFEPFFTTKERGRGTGLGLAMVYGAVKQHGGSIEVESRLGRGTLVRIFLPALPGASAGASAPRAEAAAVKGGGETILLVEDEAAVRDLAARVLQRRGYRVIACGDAGEAVAAATDRGGRVDLLLTDVVMPGMNGRVLAERLRAVFPSLKVLLTSGYSEEMVEHGAAVVPGAPFIAKPYSADGLAAKVRDVLDAG